MAIREWNLLMTHNWAEIQHREKSNKHQNVLDRPIATGYELLLYFNWEKQ